MERRRLARVARVIAGGMVVTAAALGATPIAAQAAEKTVNGVTLTWGLTQEAGGGSYAGGCNFLVAGNVGNTGKSKVWTEADGFYSASAGNVSILKDGASGAVTPTFATKCQNASGAAVTPAVGSSTNNRAVFANGAGTVDVDAGTATISWDGDMTAVSYGGMSYWYASDPVLTVKADGTGSLTAKVGGYAASMSDPTAWAEVPERTVHLANLSNVSLSGTGLTVTPDYLGVVSGVVTNQVTGTSTSGAFPDDFISFHLVTGQSSYWYSSGASADAKKVATALNVAWTLPADPQPEPGDSKGDVDVTVTVPKTDEPEPEPGSLKLTVSGTADLGQATKTATGFTAAGELPQVTVSDTRKGGSWTVSGQSSAFSSTAGQIPASAFGWAPKLVSGTAHAGGVVTGLATSAILASGGEGEAKVSADLSLNAPADTKPGDYKATVTLTALG
jgi:hypothetical protein